MNDKLQRLVRRFLWGWIGLVGDNLIAWHARKTGTPGVENSPGTIQQWCREQWR